MPKFLDCLRRDHETDIIRELKLLMSNFGQFDWQPPKKSNLDEIPINEVAKIMQMTPGEVKHESM